MFTWEFPPLISGGLGMACYGMVKALLSQGIKIDLVLPTKELVYFPLRDEGDADTLPAVFIEPEKQIEYTRRAFTCLSERLEYIGVTTHPESYFNMSEIAEYSNLIKKHYELSEVTISEELELLKEMTAHLIGDEDLIRKVQEYTLRANRFAKILEYDLIHAHDWLTYPSGILTKQISHKPLIVHIHATEFDRAGGPGDPRIHKIEYIGMTYADKVIAVSQYTAQMIMSRYRIDSGKIRIIHNAFTLPETNLNNKKRIFIGPTILYLGRVTIQKGPDYFFRYGCKSFESSSGGKIHSCWNRRYAKTNITTIGFLDLKNRFLFTGFLNRKQVERILQAADIYVFPSVSEPFGISPLEAMSYGITAIISKQSGVAEIIHHAFKIDYWMLIFGRKQLIT
jgi:glycosyltransferase involved in cell wall biosynthesis